MSLFVPEDDEYDDKRLESPEPADLPPAEISVERTAALYQRIHDDTTLLIPVVVAPTQAAPVFESREICCNLPLRFYQEIVETMLAKDGLLILGRGLGCILVVANLLYALSAPLVLLQDGPVVHEKRSLVILLNAKDEELVQLNDALMELRWLNADGGDAAEPPLRVVAGSDLANTKRRRALYERGGVVFVLSRVLVVDLLSGIIRPEDITGMVVMHTEKVRETSNESFIVNLYRDSNEWGFVKAVSDEPEAFTGFTPLATKLRILRIATVFLWPRFHVEVLSSLLKSGQRTTVTEINVRLSPKMAKIQSAVLACLHACLQELKRHNPLLDLEYWDVENVHDVDFVTRVRISLDLQWHRISWTSKQLVYDLATLRDLLSGLLTEDSLSYYQRVQGVVDANMRSLNTAAGTMGTTTMSPWLMMDEATTIISYAKERALGKVTIANTHVDLETSEETTTGKEEVYNLEELPKWEQLAMVLDDIMHERSIEKTEGPVLIMCSKERTAKQLASVLTRLRKKEYMGRKRFSCRGYMVTLLRDYLLWKALSTLTKNLALELDQKDEEQTTPEAEQLNTSKTFTRGSNAPQSKRRRTRGAAAVANVARLYSGSNFEKTAGAVELDDAIIERVEQQVKEESSDEEVEEVDVDESIADRTEQLDAEDKWEPIDKFNQVIIETYNDYTNEFLLQELSPSYVIMYEPDLSFIRRVEIYQALNPANPAKTFFMYYGTSVEEQAHLMQIRKEKSAFTKLIKEKAALGKHFATEQDNWKFLIRKPQVVNTRIAGGANFRTEADEMRIIVDTREFSSSLANLLYRVGIKVIPCMLTVGDYIISPKICVERKAIPDLISSFKSGRLYQQCEQMFRHYELPTLLIEFDESKSFSFEPFAEFRAPGQKVNAANPVGTKILKKEIQLKITELLISFPKLKVIWSSSPYETAQTFLELKASQQEPDVEEALSKGVNPSITTSEGPPMMNDDAIDILQTIPGINNVNYTTVILRVQSLQELVTLTREQFLEMLGLESGNKAYNFINHLVA